MQTGPKKKVAICFYGQVRFYEIFNLYYKHVKEELKEFEIDLFLASWNDFDTTGIDLKFTKSKYFNHDKITKSWKQGNTQKVAFLIHQVGKLKQDFEVANNFAYDGVLLIRPDIVFDLVKFKETLTYFTNAWYSKPTVLIPDYMYIDDTGAYRIDSDWMFLFTSEAFDIHASLYNYFYLQRKYKKVGIPYTEGGHWIHAHYFVYNNLYMEFKKFASEVIRPKRDLKILTDLYNKPHFIDKLIKNRVNWEKANLNGGLTHEQVLFLKSSII